MTHWLLTLVSYAKFENNYKNEMKVMVEVTLFSLLQVTTAFYHDFLMSCVFILFSHHYPKVFISNKPLCRF